MSLRHDPDQLISTWVADSVGAGRPRLPSEVLAVVERTPQQSLGQVVPGRLDGRPSEGADRSQPDAPGRGSPCCSSRSSRARSPPARSRRPAFVLQGVVPLPVSSDAVFASASDDALWATVGDAVLKIDPRTGTSTRFTVPERRLHSDRGTRHVPDSIWVADYYGNRVVRLDRSTGAFIGDVLVGEPGGLQWQDGLWVQDGGGGGVVRIAPTGDVDLRLPEAISYVVTPGALWYVDGVRRQGLGRRGGPRNRSGAPADRHSSRCRAVHHHGRHGQSMDLRSSARVAHHQGRNGRGRDRLRGQALSSFRTLCLAESPRSATRSGR